MNLLVRLLLFGGRHDNRQVLLNRLDPAIPVVISSPDRFLARMSGGSISRWIAQYVVIRAADARTDKAQPVSRRIRE